jgi:tryptophan synthase alpha chain
MELQDLFARCRVAKRSAFIPFLTAGDPTLEQTDAVIDTVIAAGADAVEIGFPYSDPLADGPVIQASYTRSLSSGTKLADIFVAVKQWTAKHPHTPFLCMVSYSLVHRQQPERFLMKASQAGLRGVIIPDLPHEEAELMAPRAKELGLALIQLVTPTTPPERAARIAATSTGFLYVVSITGITGTRTSLPEQLKQQLAELRKLTNLPLCVGFGISLAEHAKLLVGHADGVIVGSALVRCLEGEAPWASKMAKLKQLAGELRRGCESSEVAQ